MRRTHHEQSRITFRLPLDERLAAEKVCRASGVKLSDFLRQAVREKVEREGGAAPDARGIR